ncbi:MAG: hybrid sensor histidine kinase/response regulator [Myxococcales bacterium]|nr:hybrid sensor histidine kinase/response regulator [Myxococcales bacterium]
MPRSRSVSSERPVATPPGDELRVARFAIDQALDAMFRVDNRARILDVNETTCARLGYARADLVAMTMQDIDVAFDPDIFPQHFEAIRRRGRVCFESQYRTKTGEVFPVEVHASFVRVDGRDQHIAFARDMTARKQFEARMALAARTTALDTLASGAAHEINNPLTAVIGNLGLAQEAIERIPTRDPAWLELDQALRDAAQAAERIRKIVADLRTFSRNDASEPGPVDVYAALDVALRLTWSVIRHRARLADARTPVPPVLGNGSKVAQVLVNLVVNAAQSMPPERDPDFNEIRVLTRLDEGRVVIEVHDNGVGMPGHVVRRLFEPFFTTRPLGTSAGLGLAVCHGIVTSMGGEIAVQSQPGRGSLFRVMLPALENAAGATGAAAVAEPARRRVLVIDDDRPVREALARALAVDHDVTEAGGGVEALERLRRGEAFDLVLCDLMMPDLSGAAVFAAVERELPEVAMRFAFVSGATLGEEDAGFATRMGARLLQKPVGPKRLREFVRRMLPAS